MFSYSFNQSFIHSFIHSFIPHFRKWDIFSKLLQEINIPMDVLSTQIEDFKKHSASDKLDTDYELEQHLQSMKEFSDYMIRLVGKYRYTYSNVEQRNVTELGKLLM